MSGSPPAPLPGPASLPASRWSPAVVVPRLPGLLLGLVTMGFGIGLMARGGLGLASWEVLHQGIGRLVGVPLGTVSIAIGIPIMAAWWPLGERPGVGTLLNLVLIGTSANVTLGLIPDAVGPGLQAAASAAGILLIAVGSAMYLAADLGPGPRDGLMTGLHLRFGWSIRSVRTAIEVSVVVVGFVAGGTVGVGTVVSALAIGPLVQAALAVFDRDGRLSARRRAALEARGIIAE